METKTGFCACGGRLGARQNAAITFAYAPLCLRALNVFRFVLIAGDRSFAVNYSTKHMHLYRLLMNEYLGRCD